MCGLLRCECASGLLTPLQAHLACYPPRSFALCRYLYKLGKPLNFPATPEFAAELDALTLQQVEAQFRYGTRTRVPRCPQQAPSLAQSCAGWWGAQERADPHIKQRVAPVSRALLRTCPTLQALPLSFVALTGRLGISVPTSTRPWSCTSHPASGRRAWSCHQTARLCSRAGTLRKRKRRSRMTLLRTSHWAGGPVSSKPNFCAGGSSLLAGCTPRAFLAAQQRSIASTKCVKPYSKVSAALSREGLQLACTA